ncbi:hypothetical protein QLQ15_07185 [Lysobacter sp. LF1]|uniref:Uncharacterized protein n=1 Tax=Lysobacter stagni TaxID=3045172 RepID=A0ABT6XEW7_9GAMM|nr:DUF6714 family protein [Lysobacter sp. LF1]MDI9238697.1 hypothetical protein [Lysobacter sp. LF1]
MHDGAGMFDAEALKARIETVFRTHPGPPAISLRAGNAIDDGEPPPPWDAALDAPDASYMECNAWGLPHLDAASWLHYLPIFMCHALDHLPDRDSSIATDALLFSLQPPDRDPPRFGSLSSEEQTVVGQFLDLLAFDPRSKWTDQAMTALEEYWAPGATYR